MYLSRDTSFIDRSLLNTAIIFLSPRWSFRPKEIFMCTRSNKRARGSILDNSRISTRQKKKKKKGNESQVGYKYEHSILFRTAFILYTYNSLMNYGATSTSAIIFSSTPSSLSSLLLFSHFFLYFSLIVAAISSKSSTWPIFRVPSSRLQMSLFEPSKRRRV